MKKKIGDLTIREIANMRCPSTNCNKCPFVNNDSNNTLASICCDLVDVYDKFNLLEQEIEVEDNEQRIRSVK